MNTDNNFLSTYKNSKYYDFLYNQVGTLERQSYFENIKMYSSGSFLLGMYNIVSLMDEHILHIAIATTKIGSNNESRQKIKNLTEVLYNNTHGVLCDGKCCTNETNEKNSINNICTNCSLSEQFENFLIQFADKSYPEAHYKKYSAISPIDKLNNDICQYILEKNCSQVIALILTFEFILSKLSVHFNNIALPNFKLLDSFIMEKNCSLLLNILESENVDNYDNQNDNYIKTGICDTVNMFVTFFNEINNQFYCD